MSSSQSWPRPGLLLSVLTARLGPLKIKDKSAHKLGGAFPFIFCWTTSMSLPRFQVFLLFGLLIRAKESFKKWLTQKPNSSSHRCPNGAFLGRRDEHTHFSVGRPQATRLAGFISTPQVFTARSLEQVVQLRK